jgi:hypothetical protein
VTIEILYDRMKTAAPGEDDPPGEDDQAYIGYNRGTISTNGPSRWRQISRRRRDRPSNTNKTEPRGAYDKSKSPTAERLCRWGCPGLIIPSAEAVIGSCGATIGRGDRRHVPGGIFSPVAWDT